MHPLVFLAAGVRLFPVLYSQVADVLQVPAYLVCYPAKSASGTVGSCWEQQTLLLLNRFVTCVTGMVVSCCLL